MGTITTGITTTPTIILFKKMHLYQLIPNAKALFPPPAATPFLLE